MKRSKCFQHSLRDSDSVHWDDMDSVDDIRNSNIQRPPFRNSQAKEWKKSFAGRNTEEAETATLWLNGQNYTLN